MAYKVVMRIEYGSQRQAGNPSWENALQDWLFQDVADKLTTKDLANLFTRLEDRGVRIQFELIPSKTVRI